MLRFFDKHCHDDTQAFRVNAIGINEIMPPCIVNRPQGTNDFLLMHFYDPVTIRVKDQLNDYPSNTLMLWRANEGHFYGNLSNEWEHSWVHVSGRNVNEMLKQDALPEYPASIDIRALLESYLTLIYNERVQQANPNSMVMINFFQNMLIEIARKKRMTTHKTIPSGIIRARQYIENNLHQSIRLEKLAKIASYSVPHFSHEFKVYYNLSPIEYLIHQRLKQACYYLKDLNMSINEIADRLGYSDMFHFSKQFKKHYNISPSKFRKQTIDIFPLSSIDKQTDQ